MISTISKLFRLLSSDIEPRQLSLGITLGFIAGISPIFSMQSIIVYLLLIILRTNLSIFLMSFSLMSLIAYLADPVIVSIGQKVLTEPSLQALFTDMYNNGLWQFINFNNTAAMGSLLIAVVLAVPCYFLSQYLIRKYRVTVVERWKQSAVFKYMKNSKMIGKIAAISDKVN